MLVTDEVQAERGDAFWSNEIAARSPMELFWRRLRDDRVALVALGFIVFLIFVAIFAPLIVKLVGAPPPSSSPRRRSTSFGSPTGPSSTHLFGVDQLGRDVFSRVVYGTRVSLSVAFISTAHRRGRRRRRRHDRRLLPRLDRHASSRATIDVLLAFPILLLGLGLASACALGNGLPRRDRSSRA